MPFDTEVRAGAMSTDARSVSPSASARWELSLLRLPLSDPTQQAVVPDDDQIPATTRFWVPRGGRYSLGDGGYLNDPTTSWFQSELQKLPDIEARFAVLLGEPGMGKTTTITNYVQQVAKGGDNSLRVLQFDLGRVGELRELERVFCEDTDIRSWRDGSGHLVLAFDAFDEMLERLDTLGYALVEELGRLPKDRLTVRLCCRTADWPEELDAEISRVWGEQHAKHLELVPLRRSDVVDAATQAGFDAVGFLAEVTRAEAVPLAIRPVTLQLLLSLFKIEGSLPSSRSALYEQGLLALCEEPAPRRRFRMRSQPGLTAEQRLQAASRFAAVMALSSRTAIWRGAAADAAAGDIRESQLTGEDRQEGSTLSINRQYVSDVLSTGLFTRIGTDRVGWAHGTYGEYLSARRIAGANLGRRQLMALVRNPHDPSGRVAPQLHGMLSHAAEMDSEVRDLVLEMDPEAFLRTDYFPDDPVVRRRLVDVALNQARSGVFRPIYEVYSLFSRLNFEGLATQLKSTLSDTIENDRTRITAVYIAEACRATEVVPEILSIALDPTESVDLRSHAVGALETLASIGQLGALRPLLDDLDNDQDDELRGSLLLALWPELVDAQSITPYLTRPKRPSLYGDYKRFLHRRLVPGVRSAGDMAALLEWATCNVIDDSALDSPMLLDDVFDQLIHSSSEWRDDPEVVSTLVVFMMTRLEVSHHLFTGRSAAASEWLTNPLNRRRILSEIVASQKPLVYTWQLQANGLVTAEDLPWLLDRYNRAENFEERSRLIALMDAAMWSVGLEHVDLIREACLQHDALADRFSNMYFVRLDSDAAERMRSQHESMLQLAAGKEQAIESIPDPRERVLQYLDLNESGRDDAWLWVARELMREPGEAHYAREDEFNLAESYGWAAADQATKVRILQAAERYVLTIDPSDWPNAGLDDFRAIAGLRAFALIANVERTRLDALDPIVWRRWVLVLLDLPLTGQLDDEWHKDLRRRACRSATAAFADASVTKVRADLHSYSDVYALGRLEPCLDDQLVRRVVDVVMSEPGSTRALFTVMVWAIEAGATELVLEHLRSIRGTVPTGRDRLAVMAAASIAVGTKDLLAEARELMADDTQTAKAVFETLAMRRDEVDESLMWGRFRESELAELYIQMSTLFPHAEDPDQNGTGFSAVTPRKAIVRLRRSIMGALTSVGTWDAVEALRRIVRVVEGADLRFALGEAERAARSKTWVPMDPKEVVELLADRSKQPVRTGVELVDVLRDSLARFQDQLQGENAMAFTLWDNDRPKSEARFSDAIKNHLVNDLVGRRIVAAREVEIRHRRDHDAGVPGEIIDVYVSAIAEGEARVCAIVEAKGCWNDGLWTDLEAQLSNRYLATSRCRHGLYLVGWYRCSRWNEEDPRRRQCPELSIGEAQQELDRLVAARPADGLHVAGLVIDAGHH